MSEFEQTQNLRRVFLRAAYDLGMSRPGRIVGLDEIANEMQQYMDTSTTEFVARLTEIARYLDEKGWIRKQTTSYEIINITSDGIDEVERQSVAHSSSGDAHITVDRPSGRREKRRQFLGAIYDLAGGSPYQYVYWPNVASRLGWEAENSGHVEQAVAIAQYLADKGLITIEADEGTLYRITAVGIDDVEEEDPEGASAPPSTPTDEATEVTLVEEAPLHIRESLQRFRKDYPDPAAVAFILMQFRETRPHEQIVEAIKAGLAEHGITGVRADDKEYHEDLFPNVLTYMHGCGMGVAVFERIEEQVFNPNVSLEFGYMYAMRKPLCLLKDQPLTALHTDLVGKLYRSFDSYNPADTIPPQLSRWLTDRALSKR